MVHVCMMVAKSLLQHFMTLPDRHLMQFPEVGQIIAEPESNVVRIITITAGIPILWAMHGLLAQANLCVTFFLHTILYICNAFQKNRICSAIGILLLVTLCN